MTEQELKLRELAWHRHPVFVALLSFLLAGLLLFFIQNKTSKSTQLREKKIDTLEDVSFYLAKADRVYRDLRMLGSAKGALPVAEFDDLQNKLAQDVDDVYKSMYLLESSLLIYFPGESAYELIRDAKTALRNQIDASVSKLRASSGPVDLVPDQEFNEQAARFARIEMVLAKAIGFPDLEKKRRLPNKLIDPYKSNARV